MYYADARQTIRSGDLLAWSHRGWKSWHDIKLQIVRMVLRSEYSHIGIAWVIGNRVFVLEAVHPLVRIFPLSKCGDFYWMPLGAKWSDQTEEVALSKIGFQYSQIKAMEAFFIPVDDADGQAECAQYALSVLAADGFDLGNRATPDSVVLAAQKLGANCTYVLNKIL